MGDILVVTNEADVDADFVVREAGSRGHGVVRLNTEHVSDWEIELEPGIAWKARHPLRQTDSGCCTGVWWRRPLAPAKPDGVAEPEWDAVVDQWWALLDGLATVPGPIWVSEPWAIRRGEDKAAQLVAARRTGLPVPATTWTNELSAVGTRIEAHENEAVVKSVATAYWELEEQSHFVFAAPVGAADLPDTSQIKQAPVAVQERVRPKQDVRVTVVGQRALAALRVAPAHGNHGVDWRLEPESDWMPYNLPDRVANACVSLVEALGLRYSGIDLLVDVDGSHWFCELNPNGEWGWLQSAGLPIAAALTSMLSGA